MGWREVDPEADGKEIDEAFWNNDMNQNGWLDQKEFWEFYHKAQKEMYE